MFYPPPFVYHPTTPFKAKVKQRREEKNEIPAVGRVSPLSTVESETLSWVSGEMEQEPTEEAFEITLGDQTEFVDATHLEDLLESCKFFPCLFVFCCYFILLTKFTFLL